MSDNRTLRRLLLSAVITAAVFCVGSPPAWADPFSVTIVVNENGQGTLTNTAGFFGVLPSSTTTADPGPGGLAGVLSYGLLNPPGLVGGDVVLLETGGQSSDLLRFDLTVGGGTLFFYSDIDGGIDALADIGMPTGLNTNVLRFLEVQLAEGFGLTYTPTADQPGFVAGAAGPVTYTFISDSAVPEPASLLLLGTGLVGLVRMRRRRQ